MPDFNEVLANGSIAEVKAVLRAYIGRIDVDYVINKREWGSIGYPLGLFHALSLSMRRWRFD